jgi:hypothetical protein
MKISVSSDLVWKIAIREAATGEFKEIEPDHFCLAVLKFAELSAKGVEEAGAEAELSQHIAGDAQLVREGLQKCGIESTGARRKLRRQLGKGDTPHIGVTIHRSASSRALFESAARLASESGSAVTPLHLLTALVEAPTPAIEQAVLGKAPEPPSPTALPLLDKHDRDLVKRLAEEKIQVKPGIAAQSKALLQALEQKNRKSILLVSHSDDRVADLAAALAGAIAAKGAPDGLKGRRLMDISENSRHTRPRGSDNLPRRKKPNWSACGHCWRKQPPIRKSSCWSRPWRLTQRKSVETAGLACSGKHWRRERCNLSAAWPLRCSRKTSKKMQSGSGSPRRSGWKASLKPARRANCDSPMSA